MPALKSREDDDFSHHDYESWIEATYTDNGSDVFALISHAMEGDAMHPCHTAAASANCWLNEITAAVSHNGGASFQLYPLPERVVASTGDHYNPNSSKPLGFLTTSNIIKRDNYYYVVIFVRGSSNQVQGNCLARTAQLFNSTSWLGWNGVSFGASLIEHPGQSSLDKCKPLNPTMLDQPVRSISYLTSHHVYVADFASRRLVEGHLTEGVFYATSVDLVHWSSSNLLMKIPLSRDRARCNSFIRYPVLLDPTDRSRNFENLANSPELVFVTQEVRNCVGTYSRSLDFLPVVVGNRFGYGQIPRR